MPTSSSGNEPRITAALQINPAKAPTAVPNCSAGRRPKVRASRPIGTVLNHKPNIIAEIGSVVEEHLKSIGMIIDPELSDAQRALIAEKRSAYENRAKKETPEPADEGARSMDGTIPPLPG